MSKKQKLQKKIYEILTASHFGSCVLRESITKEIIQMLKKDQFQFFPIEPDLADESECKEIKQKVLNFAKEFEKKFNCKIYHIFLKSKQNHFFEVMFAIEKEIAMKEEIYENIGDDPILEIYFLPFGQSLNPLAIKYDDFYEYIEGKWTKEFFSLQKS
jgi:hypothetical protein